MDVELTAKEKKFLESGEHAAWGTLIAVMMAAVLTLTTLYYFAGLRGIEVLRMALVVLVPGLTGGFAHVAEQNRTSRRIIRKMGARIKELEARR